MKKLLVITTLLMLFLVACSPKPKPEAAIDETAIQAEIQTLMAEMTSSAEKMSTDALQKYLSDESYDSFYMGAKEFTKAELMVEIQKAYEPFVSQTLKTTKSTIRVLSPEYVLFKALMESTATQKDGKTADLKLTETWLWHKTDAGWKVIHYDESW